MNHTEMLKLLLKMWMTKSTSPWRVVIPLILLSERVNNMLKQPRILLYGLKIAIHYLNLDKAKMPIIAALIIRAKLVQDLKFSLETNLYTHLHALI